MLVRWSPRQRLSWPWVAFLLSASCTAAEVKPAPAEADKFAWLVPTICVDRDDRPIPVDPYPACPEGSQSRKLKNGDLVPYRLMDQTGDTARINYPRMDATGSRKLVVSTFTWTSLEREADAPYRPWADGYDVQEARDGWVSVSETRSGRGEYATTFMTSGCKNYNGLILFPASGETVEAGSAMLPIASNAWEESNTVWPGKCPAYYVPDQLTVWSHVSGLSFGGAADASARVLDAIVATSGLRRSKDPEIMKRWTASGHLERFYFTRLYGFSRWENWVPRAQLDDVARARSREAGSISAARKCKPIGEEQISAQRGLGTEPGAPVITMDYQGQAFVLVDCRDWTNIEVVKVPFRPPAWPASPLNLLKDFHFSGTQDEWRQNWVVAGLENVERRLSTTPADTQTNTPVPLAGVPYLRIDCSRDCGFGQIYQNVPVGNSVAPGRVLTVGLMARSATETGQVRVTLSQFDRNGKEIGAASSFTFDLKPSQSICDRTGTRCQDLAFRPEIGEGSVVTSSAFLDARMLNAIDRKARMLRYSISPTSGVVDIVSAWLLDAN